MGKKVFVSYKYGDTNVQALPDIYGTKVRDYVDIIQDLIGEDNINMGEKDDEDLSNFKDSTIESKLRSKIFNSSVTLVVISKGMKEYLVFENDQWIPWEVSYSLKEHTRNGRKSLTNAVLAVVLPDIYGSYSYFIEDFKCGECTCRMLNTYFLFKILKGNMFNEKEKTVKEDCDVRTIYTGNPSYIHSVKWCDFVDNVNEHIDEAVGINSNISNYNIVKVV